MALTKGEKIALFMLLSGVSRTRLMVEGHRAGPFTTGTPRPPNTPAEFLGWLKQILRVDGLGFNLNTNHWDTAVDDGVSMMFVGPTTSPGQRGNVTIDPLKIAQALSMSFYDPDLGCPDNGDEVAISNFIITNII
jgi:hypothetical protein